ncbi:TetR/AcrR family transcriptional regulator [Aliigemmobacter aestuarii]|uniref:TetR/AcrR family transcriptional regulator n=1 Tax=Aliigemmobacter aestuarii TaxID=1445661 RepID=A0A4S3MPW2_9RHOB|nr:TetR/AcrR family transcriptional regulator [Gemmobacter aestuarii]THD84550.1 TetR/AcrR family transcriptional regulator [Gemmobacter aestuarii]
MNAHETLSHRFADHLIRQAQGQPKGRRTEAQIAAAACGLLDRMEPQELQILEICGAAGISTGTFYIYFRDRAALLDHLLDGFVTFLQERMRAASNAGGAAAGATAAYFDLFRANAGLMRCLIHGGAGFPAAREAFQRLNRDWIERIVAAAARRPGAPPTDELTRRAYALGGMVDMYLSALFLTQDQGLAAVSGDRHAVLETLNLIWERGMQG